MMKTHLGWCAGIINATGEIMTHNSAAAGADTSLGVPESDIVYTLDSSLVCAGRLAASSDTNEPP